eukprot:CAMPEP_0171111114 /NCGR_PEP_ID=MMETSP0766_2-20121228/73902_1 /TAXON_ID=439317 /ORGANISM="Gambierdiscus australes, Strain CAWD 149" /LENGTH=56 /DNA_ID=CAMNT_0011573065 /DNA_START=41 /DNA_END=208 /DNA_ORIENTATION=+
MAFEVLHVGIATALLHPTAEEGLAKVRIERGLSSIPPRCRTHPPELLTIVIHGEFQ